MSMNDRLATIQQIKSVCQCPNSDNLDLVQILGWQVVTKRNEFLPGDLAVYITIDSILPEKPEFEFLRNKNFRIKPIRLRGNASAGICFPLSILPPRYNPLTFDLNPWQENEDVTDIINVKKYEKPMPAQLAGQAFGSMPSFIIITDELNIRNYPDALPEMYGRPFYITTKIDGSSCTFFIKDGEFGVCSRRIHLKDSETNGFWQIARKYDIENVLKKAFPNKNVAIQGEVYGEGIQKNPLGITGIDINIFTLFDIQNRIYLNYEQLVEFTGTYNIPVVHTICEGSTFPYTLEELIKLANEQKYPNGQNSEGIVIRPKESFRSLILNKTWSGKIINEFYKDSE